MILYQDKAILLIRSNKMLPRVWLLFGNDQAALKELLVKIKQRLITPEVEVINLIAKDLDLSSLFLQRSLFHTNKVIILEEVTDDLAKDLEQQLSYLGSEDSLLLLGEDLKKNGPLRTLIEKSQDLAAVNCYRLDSYALISQIENQLKARNLQYERDIPAKIAELVQREVIERELDKLELFLAGRRDRLLTEEILLEVITIKPEVSLDKVFITIVLKKDKEFCREMNKVIINDLSPMLFIKSLQNFLQRIISVQEKFASLGKDAALDSLNPPLFGEAKRVFLEVSQKSDMTHNIRLLEKAFEAEIMIKEGFHKELETIYQIFIKECYGF
jgi:DNA polymerase III delta subunit